MWPRAFLKGLRGALMDDRGVYGMYLSALGFLTFISFFVAPWQISLIASVFFALAFAFWWRVLRR